MVEEKAFRTILMSGFRFDQQGNLRIEGQQSGIVTYSQLWVTSGNFWRFSEDSSFHQHRWVYNIKQT